MKRKQSAKQFVKAIEKAIDASPKHNRCDQCEALVINGIYCHETGCPNSRKTWVADRQAWILFLPCSVCGFDVEADEYCGCEDSEEWITDDDAESEDAE